MKIERAAVIGAGVMGAGIAAHFANAGIPVVLLDIPAKEGDRSAIAKGAVAKMLKTDPAPFMHRGAAKLVTTGNLEDDLHLLGDVDWIVEAIIENPAIKADLYKRIDPVRKAGSVVSSNTSTIPLAVLTEGQSDRFKSDFLITHFFNPPRYMRLLEIVGGPQTRPDALAAVAGIGDRRLGKGVVHCKDTPGFIANRIGVLWIQAAVNAAIDLGLTVEEADAVGGRPMGIPKTGVFGLMDLVGLDLMPHIAKSMLATLPADDAYRGVMREHPVITKMIAEGYTGRKGKGGFYRINKAGGGKVKESVDLRTGAYAPSEKARLESVSSAGRDLRKLCEHPDKGGQFARRVLAQTLAYAASLVPQIADSIVAVDEGMRLGYAWKQGPFELIDRLGTAWFAELCKSEGIPVPALVEIAAGRPFYRVEDGKLQHLTTAGVYDTVVRSDGVLLLSDVKRAAGKPVWKNASASLWDIGDGVLCVEFTSKMNAVDGDIMAAYGRAMKLIGDGKGDWKALVIHNEADNFSVGANLGLALFALNIGLWPQIEEMVEAGQRTYRALRYAPFPVVAAPSGMALGGGCEILLHSDHVQAHAETYVGLVEVGVGLIPAWGGCTEMLARHAKNPRAPRGPMPAVAKAFEIISTATVAKSAAEAKELLYFRSSDGVTMNRDRLLADAKAKALQLAENYTPPEKDSFVLPGPTARAALELAVEGFALQGKVTEHDKVVCAALADVLSGGPDADASKPVGEDAVLELERSAFMKLVHTNGTIDRIEHMLLTGKPLRN
ncbi:3-hydroxyacyl-CoA dehydrogenase NAD-binding domain-containing protein [Azospirillum doebereinerae]|uniref:3-hydroxyacyl-CoA dehydrogenase/enoyl-CoA hydratase family protein n=1 Tax=Azospirillum doebereinerae TaxID=92933 RepID=UPI001EE52451|nr:3-hydroxyacyl-CoA dehydrogenase/enoyl-CoA hydratase family protein [Azospirillum doebereinerae]MCG5242967.1 3-hydroxyacyl-CoA dehydrogenase NAD-binding domain-containing protein [Azospirillum doebereinerae]